MSDATLKKFEVQCGRSVHEARTFSVAATSKEEACRIAIGLAERTEGWKATGDPVSATFMDAIGPDEQGAWSEPAGGEAAVPYRFTQEGTLFEMPWQPAGQVAITAGTYLVEYVSADTGHGIAYGAFEYDPDAPPARAGPRRRGSSPYPSRLSGSVPTRRRSTVRARSSCPLPCPPTTSRCCSRRSETS